MCKYAMPNWTVQITLIKCKLFTTKVLSDITTVQKEVVI